MGTANKYKGKWEIMKTYEETVEAILEIPRFSAKNKPEHTRELLRRLGSPQNNFKVIHVAGSNGKGSVCAFLDSILRASGKRVGLFTSPHLMYIEERFQVGGRPCDRECFVRAVQKVGQTVDSMMKQGMPHPSFFEYVFATGMLIFAEYQAEYVVLETGLGGRLDATNIVERPLLTVITPISLEHTEILGDTVAKIAAEKAGIIKPGVPIVYDASLPEAGRVIVECARRRACMSYPVFPDKVKILLIGAKKIAFSYDCGYDGTVTEFEIPFAAPYQAQNAAIALQAVNCIAQSENIPHTAIRQGLAEVRWPGRMQQVRPDVYFDGAHNADGILRFLEAAGQVSGTPAVLLFAMVKEKDYVRAAEDLLQKGEWENIIITCVPGNRGADCHMLAEVFERTADKNKQTVKITEIEQVEEAYAYALSAKKPGQILFCAGSLYLIGALERIAGGME
jgi:dihydrofolate synthase/folylpolyglutamate synthase